MCVVMYAMFETSTSANCKDLSMLGSLVTRSREPPNVTVEPTVTFGPSDPHRFFESLSAKWAWMGKGAAECVKMTY